MTIKEVLERNNFVVLDTETTGIHGAEPVSIAIIDPQGNVLINTLVKPTIPISEGAKSVHGIGEEQVKDAPTWEKIHDEVQRIIDGKDIIIYNAAYDTEVIHNACRAAKVIDLMKHAPHDIECAMLAYAEHHGEWDEYRQSYRWVKLTQAIRYEGIEVKDAHAALGDCLMTLALCRKVWGNGTS